MWLLIGAQLFDRIRKDAHGPDSSVNALVISGKGKEYIAPATNDLDSIK